MAIEDLDLEFEDEEEELPEPPDDPRGEAHQARGQHTGGVLCGQGG